MTSCFHILVHLALGIDNIDVVAVLSLLRTGC